MAEQRSGRTGTRDAGAQPGQVLRFPSADAPPLPSFQMTHPSDWVVAQTPGCLFEIGTPDGSGSVAVGVERADGRGDLEALMQQQLSAIDGTRVSSHVETRLDLGEHPAIMRLLHIDGTLPADDRFHAVVLVLAPRLVDGPTQDLVWLHGECPSQQADEWIGLVTELARSLRFGQPGVPA